MRDKSPLAFRRRSRPRAIKTWQIGSRFSYAALSVAPMPKRRADMLTARTLQNERDRQLRRPLLLCSNAREGHAYLDFIFARVMVDYRFICCIFAVSFIIECPHNDRGSCRWQSGR
jgi:hypothetical protein